MLMSDSLQTIILDASFLPVVVAGSVGLVRFRQLEAPVRYLAVLVFFELFIEVLSRILIARHRSNLFLTPIDTLVEFGLLTLMYRRALHPLGISRWLGPAVGVFALASLLPFLQPTYLSRFNTGQRFVESLVIMALVLCFLYKILRELVIVRLEREPLFWASAGLLLYFAGNVFIFVSSNYVLQYSQDLSMTMWDIHAILYMVLHGFYIAALWANPQRKT